jgi:hypothetical protein
MPRFLGLINLVQQIKTLIFCKNEARRLTLAHF